MKPDRRSWGRSLPRDIGGLPIWACVAVVAVLAIGFVALSTGTLQARSAPPYSAPSDAPTPSIPAPMPLAVFLGDSYTQGVGGDGVRWTDVVGDAKGWDVSNLALGGTGYVRTAGSEGCGRTYCGTYSQASEEIVGNPKYIIIAGGRNDLGLPADEIGDAADRLLDDLESRYPEAEIVIVNPWFDDAAPPASLTAMSEELHAVADAHDALFIDTGQPLRGRTDLISADGIHPNAAGYKALAKAVQKQLDPALAP